MLHVNFFLLRLWIYLYIYSCVADAPKRSQKKSNSEQPGRFGARVVWAPWLVHAGLSPSSIDLFATNLPLLFQQLSIEGNHCDQRLDCAIFWRMKDVNMPHRSTRYIQIYTMRQISAAATPIQTLGPLQSTVKTHPFFFAYGRLTFLVPVRPAPHFWAPNSACGGAKLYLTTARPCDKPGQ